jgi:ADP-heptose:LPS heptosyltransferase
MNQLGDLLFSLPVLDAIRHQTTDEIYSIVKPSLAPLLKATNLVDATFDKDQPFLSLLKELRQHNFDKALLFSESPSSLLAAYFSKIKNTIGFNTASLSFLLKQKVQRTGVPSIINNRKLGLAAGLENIKQDYTDIVIIPAENTKNVLQWFADKKIDPQNTIALSPSTSKNRKDKQLPYDLWALIIDDLFSKGFTIVLSGAPYEKADLEKLSKMCKSRPEIFTAENGILDSAAFLKSCSFFLGTDSGAMHLAAAVLTKCVGIFINTDPLQIGPRPLGDHLIIKNPKSTQDIVSLLLPYMGQKCRIAKLSKGDNSNHEILKKSSDI